MNERHSVPPDVRDGVGRSRRALHGRRKGRPLRPHRATLVETLLPTLELTVAGGSHEPIDPAGWFPSPVAEIWLEIGFGAGEHLAWQARHHPEIGFVGCEPFLNGVARLLSDIDTRGLTNIRIFRDDARMLIARLADASIARAFVLFPDPWPKTRHHKRRIVGPATVPQLARILRDGAELRVATDVADYQGWILQYVLASGAFRWPARRPSDWRERPADWPATRYETKAAEAGRRAAFFRFTRVPRPG
jgi:tRNA (guanine-N7-)-methyltransferase